MPNHQGSQNPHMPAKKEGNQSHRSEQGPTTRAEENRQKKNKREMSYHDHQRDNNRRQQDMPNHQGSQIPICQQRRRESKISYARYAQPPGQQQGEQPKEGKTDMPAQREKAQSPEGQQQEEARHAQPPGQSKPHMPAEKEGIQNYNSQLCPTTRAAVGRATQRGQNKHASTEGQSPRQQERPNQQGCQTPIGQQRGRDPWHTEVSHAKPSGQQ